MFDVTVLERAPFVGGNAGSFDLDGIPVPYDPVVSIGSDSDSDLLTDLVECLGGWPCPDTNLDGRPNYMISAIADSDGDGVINDSDSAPANPNVCRDTDSDTCDDCATKWQRPP